MKQTVIVSVITTLITNYVLTSPILVFWLVLGYYVYNLVIKEKLPNLKLPKIRNPFTW